MATLTIRKLDDSIKRCLRIQAANHGVSMEEEARRILAGLSAKEKRQTAWGPEFTVILYELEALIKKALFPHAQCLAQRLLKRGTNDLTGYECSFRVDEICP